MLIIPLNEEIKFVYILSIDYWATMIMCFIKLQVRFYSEIIILLYGIIVTTK